MNGLNRRRGVRPLAPGDPATGNGHLYGDEDAGEVVPVALEPTVAGTAGYRREDILSLMAQGLVRQLCLWGESGTVEVCRIRLRRVLRLSDLYDALLKVVRVSQPNGRVRFDVFVPTEQAPRILRRIQRNPVSREYNWYCREHRPYGERQRPTATLTPQRYAPPVEVQNPEAVGTLRVGTYNINGIRSKRTDVRAFLQHSKIDVLGIQETLLKADDWSLRFPQYTCYTTSGHSGPSTRGVALAISKLITSMVVGPASPYWLLTRIMGGSLRAPMIVGTVYVPRRQRRQVLHSLGAAISTLKTKYPNDAIVLVGDFNRLVHQLQTTLANWPVPLQVLPRHNDAPTHRRGRAIDHIAYWGLPETGQNVPPANVLSDWDLSDHYPVVAHIPYLKDREIPTPTTEAGGRPRIRVHIPEKRMDIACSNYWAPLMEDTIELQEVGEVSAKWETACHEVASELNLHPAAQPARSSLPLSTMRAIARRRRRYKQLVRAKRNHHGVQAAQGAYDKEVIECKTKLRKAADKTATIGPP